MFLRPLTLPVLPAPAPQQQVSDVVNAAKEEMDELRGYDSPMDYQGKSPHGPLALGNASVVTVVVVVVVATAVVVAAAAAAAAAVIVLVGGC